MPHNRPRSASLPFGIQLSRLSSKEARIKSCLVREFSDGDANPSSDAIGRAAADAVESLLLALWCAGVELDTDACKEAVQSAVEAIANKL